MRAAAIAVYLTTILVFLQFVTGGTFLLEAAGYPSVAGTGDTHMSVGYIAALFALAAVILVWVSKPAHWGLRYASTSAFVLMFFQGGLGFEKTTILEHYLLGTLVFISTLAATFFASRWNKMPKSMVPAVLQPTS